MSSSLYNGRESEREKDFTLSRLHSGGSWAQPDDRPCTPYVGRTDGRQTSLFVACRSASVDQRALCTENLKSLRISLTLAPCTVCVSLFYVNDIGSIGSRGRAVTNLSESGKTAFCIVKFRAPSCMNALVCRSADTALGWHRLKVLLM